MKKKREEEDSKRRKQEENFNLLFFIDNGFFLFSFLKAKVVCDVSQSILVYKHLDT